MPIDLDQGDDQGDDHESGIDLSQLFRVLIREVEGVRKAQQDTRDLLSRSLQMKETFTTNQKTQQEARDIRGKVNTSSAKPSIDSNMKSATPKEEKGSKTDNPLAGYTDKSSFAEQAKHSLGSAIPAAFPTNADQLKNTGKNFGLDLLNQLGGGIRSSIFANWERRDRAQEARQNGNTVPASADDRLPRNEAPEGPAPAPSVSRVTKDKIKSSTSSEEDLSSPTTGSGKSRRISIDAIKRAARQRLNATRHHDTQGDDRERIMPTNEGEEEITGSAPPPAEGHTWSYDSASPGGPMGWNPNHPNGPYGPYGRYGTSSTTGGGGGGGGHYGGGGHGGGGGGYGGGSAGSGSYGENTGIVGWAKKNIPGVGLLFGGADEFKSQRNKNAYYQNIEGGSNLSGVAERAHEEAYAATAGGMFGAFSEKEAREAFKGVTRIGYNGKQGQDFSTQAGRQKALDFTYHAKTSYGADVSESLRQLEAASKDATINLSTLQASLKGVSDAAGKAGVNAQMARQNLMNLIAAGQNSGMNGAMAQNAAGPIAEGQASMGRDFENYNYSGQMSPGVQYIQAAQAGMTRGQFMEMQQNNPVAAQKIVTGNKLQQIQNALPPDMIQAIQAELKNTTGTVDEPQARQIALKILKQFPNYNDPAFWQGYIATTGADPNGNPTLWLTDAIMTIAGQDPQLKAAEKSTAGQPQTATPDSKGNLPSGVQTTKEGFMDKGQYGKWQSDAKAGGHAAASALMDEEKQGGRNRVIEGILQNTQHADHTNVEVHTKSGVRVVSLADAIKNHPQELSSGDVKFVSGDNAGKTAADVVGQANVNSQADWTSEAKKDDSSGQSLDDYNKKHPSDNQKGGTGANGSVIFDLTAAAKQLLQPVQTSGAVQQGQAAGQGSPVPNYYADNPTRNGSYGG